MLPCLLLAVLAASALAGAPAARASEVPVHGADAGAVSTSDVGSVAVWSNNTAWWSGCNDTVTISSSDWRAVVALNLTVSAVTARPHWLPGLKLVATQALLPLVAAGPMVIKARAQSLPVGYRTNMIGANWYCNRVEAGHAAPLTYQVFVTDDNSSEPSYSWTNYTEYELHDVATLGSWVWHASPAEGMAETFWIGVNASWSNGTDQLGLWQRSAGGPAGNTAYYDVLDHEWVDAPINDLAVLPLAVRVDASNATWTSTDPRSVNARAYCNGHNYTLTSGVLQITDAEVLAAKSARLTVTSNTSCSFLLEYDWIAAPPVDEEPPGRSPDHLAGPEPWAPPAWPWRFGDWLFGSYGWYVFVLASELGLILLSWFVLTTFRPGLASGVEKFTRDPRFVLSNALLFGGTIIVWGVVHLVQPTLLPAITSWLDQQFDALLWYRARW